MRARRALQVLTLGGSLLLVLIALTWMVSVLDGPIGIAIMLTVTLVALLALRMARHRVASRTVLELDLDAGVVEKPPTELLDRVLNRGAVVLRDAVDALDRATQDDRVVGLVTRLGNGGLSVAHAQELRDAVQRFRQAGKTSVAFSESFGESGLAVADYSLAAAFEEIHLQPLGTVSIQGVMSRAPFLKRGFGRLGIEPDLDHRSEYKAMKYLFTEDHYVEPHEEATRSILQDHLDQMIAGIATDRGLDAGQVRETIEGAPLYGQEAVDSGLVDRISHRDEAYMTARGDVGKFMYADEYLKRAGRPHRRGKRIALIYGTGSITRGSSGFDPLQRGSSFGADDVAKAIRQAIDDRRVQAIVFRVDSRGGSVVGSEVVHREVTRAREAGKPVVVSMGSVAGSGGYFVAAGADRIVAQPGTLTGSIGVVTGKLATGEAWRRIGVDWGELSIGRNAAFSSPLTPFSEAERERLKAGIDVVYRGFKQRVADGRAMTMDQVEEAAKGRVWTGRRAHELGLVDELGGLDLAIEVAGDLAGIDAATGFNVQLFPRERLLRAGTRKPSSEPIKELLRVLAAFEQRAPVELRMQPDRAV